MLHTPCASSPGTTTPMLSKNSWGARSESPHSIYREMFANPTRQAGPALRASSKNRLICARAHHPVRPSHR